MSRLKPVAVEVEEAVVGPMTGRDEEDQEEDGTVDAWSVEEVRQDEKGDDESADRLGKQKVPWASWSISQGSSQHSQR